ncbi:hypothetical protein TrVE_jg11278 [Triparma verrucosa]|uniref:Proteasome endopeptidase complex n=2 Tax=Triparma TaxID=722752 RepID=A0A9W7BJE6_9STRA|nr:hypothetical protein TrST_g6157 [Triparma strigata]GMI13500.1 hypothetical protein TrVE_jg11278 [Triparma verrucosa]
MLIMYVLGILLCLKTSTSTPFKYQIRSTGTTILGIRVSAETVVLASDSRTTIQGAIASDVTIKLHDVIDSDDSTLQLPSQSSSQSSQSVQTWPSTIMSNSIPYVGSLVSSKQEPVLATIAGAGTSGDVTYIVDEIKSECRIGLKLNDGVTCQEILDKIKDLTMTGKKECSLILGLVGSNTCSCQIIDSTNGSREVLHYVALGSGGPFATAYLDSVLTGAEKKVNMSVEEGVGVAVRGVLKGVECDEFSGGRVEVVIMRKGGKVERWRFTPVVKRTQQQMQDESDDDDEFKTIVRTDAEREEGLRRLKKLIEDPD